ncbi:MBL fold metallo-hydrolase [Aerococcus mictus]|uniref:MBL fold metallo-hydrolase n=1 Tax=Aerococcus mictus TaxID=2976810 RepID=UPI001245880D|nr:MBL fold metallo-hydrolase [Aerococcus mictus]KAA9232801.1 MBL fold metallo-hydrolase [Aerococcus mictus]
MDVLDKDAEQKDFTMRICMLASGSTGNVTYIETPQRNILVDAGLSGKRIEELLQKIGRDAKDLDAIFISHEHSDHSKGAGIMARRYQLPIYANADTWSYLEQKCGKLDADQKIIMEPGERISFGDVDILSFPVSHDSINAQFYAFQKDGKQFAMMTDLGYVSDRLADLVYNSDALMIESNYDNDMLRMGKYPWRLKQRIFSDRGHLSNVETAEALTKMIGERTKRVYLGHISRENNLNALALETNTAILKENGLGVGYDFDLYETHHYQPTDLFTL